MVQYVMLDEKIAGAFAGLYQGDIIEAVRPERFSFGTLVDGKPAALFIATFIEDYVSLDWIYVSEEFRNMEIGRRMTSGAIRIMREIFGLEIITASCDSVAMKIFLEHCGFVFSETRVYSSFRAKLSDQKHLPELEIPENTVYSLSELSSDAYDALSLYFETLRDTEIPISLPIRKEDYLDVPAVCIENDYIRATLLLKKSDPGIAIAFAYAFDRDGKALAMLIQEAGRAVREQFGENVEVFTSSIGVYTEKMMDKMFKNVEKKMIWCGSYIM